MTDISAKGLEALTKEMAEYAAMLDGGLAAGTPGDTMRDAIVAINALRAALDQAEVALADMAAQIEEWKKSATDSGMKYHEASIRADIAEADKAAAVRAEMERCAVVAETVTERQHIAHDICRGDFPKRSDMRDFIAAAIRSGGEG